MKEVEKLFVFSHSLESSFINLNNSYKLIDDINFIDLENGYDEQLYRNGLGFLANKGVGIDEKNLKADIIIFLYNSLNLYEGLKNEFDKFILK